MKLLTFRKGIHPVEYKELSAGIPVKELPLPDEVLVPLQQHLGVPCSPIVSEGDSVKTGQVIGKSEKLISAPVHSPVTGKVKAIGRFLHPLGIELEMVQIVREGDDEWELLPIPDDWRSVEPRELVRIIQQAGIVGMGGAAFPTHVKLAPPPEKRIDSFILNGCECEPYLTADHRTMLEFPDQVLLGVEIISRILGVQNVYLGIEDNKPDAIQKMNERIRSLGYDFKVVPLRTKYPQGAEKMLIDAILQREVPVGGLPMDVGVVVHNVGTAMAIARAVTEGKPLIERVVTVTGNGVKHPGNFLVRLGTTFKQLIDHCGGLKPEARKVLMGGPMMGIAQSLLNVPVVKATSGIVCLTEEEVQSRKHFPCVKCGNCVSACPMFLLPTRLARMSELGFYEDVDKLGILNCIECGSCAYACPSHIPLVQFIRLGKLKVSQLRRQRA